MSKAIVLWLTGIVLCWNAAGVAAAGTPAVAPLINPLADMSGYAAADFSHNEKWRFRYRSKEGAWREKVLFGDGWVLTLAKQAAGQSASLDRFVPAQNATLHWRSEQEIFFETAVGEAEVWWVHVEEIGDQYRITQAREVRLNPGAGLSWRLGEGGMREVVFYTRHGGDELTNFRLALEAGAYQLKGDAIVDDGELRRTVSYFRDFKAQYDKLHILNDIPKGFAAPVCWKLWRRDDGPLADVVIHRDRIAAMPVPPVKVTEALGALKVEGTAGMRVEVEPLHFMEVSHAKVADFSSDATPGGDALLWLPAGLWNVKVAPGGVTGIDHYQTTLVPVNSGETTLLTLPAHLTATLSEHGGNGAFSRRKGLKIGALKEDARGRATTTFTLFDPQQPDVVPDVKRTTVLEGGTRAAIETIERLDTAPHVVLLLDSSGSMKGQMQTTLRTARQFIGSLPEETSIQVVDFDTRPRQLKGTNRDEVLAGLGRIRADGATALYDAILKGLELLRGRERPSLLVFTDGVDANWNDTGPGSAATRAQVFSAAKEAGIPFYTIGFGPGHDNTTLKQLAELSDGRYYPATDQNALEAIFTTIKNDLGNSFQLTYKRPACECSRSVPAIAISIDISGSMNPLDGGILQKVKNLFHDFILKLPERTPVQLQAYDETTTVRQLITRNKSELLQALGELTHRGNNETFRTVGDAFELARHLPSDKRILIYVSDKDLGLVRSTERDDFEKLLGRFKKEKIKVLWVGFCMDDAKDVYVRTAERSGGQYVISEDPAVLAGAFDRIVAEVASAEPALPDELPVTLTVRHADGDGAVYQYEDSRRVKLSPPEIVERTTDVTTASYRTGLAFEPYDPVSRQTLAGDDYPGREAVIAKRLPLDAASANSAVEIRAAEALLLNRLQGLDAPEGMQFAALILEMSNRLPEQEVIVYPDGGNHPAAWVGANAPEGKRLRKVPSYLIKNLASHLYLNWNDGSFPASPVTWLAEEPFLEPGNLARTVEPGQPARGVVLFVVPDQHLQRASLHLYDTEYGHVHLPLVGKLEVPETPLEALPLEHEVKLSESFSLKVKRVRASERIGSSETDDTTLFRIVDAHIVSKVQALLDINPGNHFYHRMPTAHGPFYLPLSPATQLLPFGFAHPAMFAPGTTNPVRFAFRVPRSLAKQTPGELFVELGGGDVVVPLGENPSAAAPKHKLSGDGIDLVVNQLAPTGDGAFLVADLTLYDHPDGTATRLADAFHLVRDDFAGEAVAAKNGAKITQHKGLGGFAGNRTSDEYLFKPDQRTRRLLLGLDEQAVVFDGTARRGIVLFRMPPAGDHTWRLQSELFAELNREVEKGPFAPRDWLAEKSQLSSAADSYRQKLSDALEQAVREYQALRSAEPRPGPSRVGLDGSAAGKERVPVPPSTFAGLTQFDEIKDLDELKAVLKATRWLPGQDGGWRYNFAPQAVLTQGWGTEGDLARMAEQVLVRMGYTPKRRRVRVTAKGSEALLKLGRLERVDKDRLPALYYRDRSEGEHLLVLPFLKEVSELEGLVETTPDQDFYQGPEQANLTVVLKVVPKSKDRNAQMRDMSGALAGGESTEGAEEVAVLDTSIDLDLLSRDAIDLGYTVVGREKGELIAAVVETARNRIEGTERVDTGLYRVVGERISVRIGDRGGRFVHESPLAQRDALSARFHTLGINLPDMTEAAANRLQQASDNAYRAAKSPDELSALRWYTRNIINRFIVSQSRYERELARKLDLTLGRTIKGRCLMVTVKREPGGERLHTSIDLMRVDNQIHKGEPTARHAFNIFAGLYASKLEAEVLPGAHLGLFELWRHLPKETRLVSVTSRNQQEIVAEMEAKVLPRSVIERLRNTRRAVLIPAQPALIDGRERWAWLEIDPEDYRTIAVLDTGERGAMLEHVLGNWQQEGTNFIVGGLIGVDAAIWSMGAFSLKLEDYDEIKAQAEAFALGLAGNFGADLETFEQKAGDATVSGGVGIGIGGTPGAAASMGPISASFDMISGKGAVSQNVLGYGNGFKAGVMLFFSDTGDAR